MISQVKLTDIIAPSFYQLHHDIKNHKYTHYWLNGGRGSTKSTFVADEIITGMMRNPEYNAVCFRKVADTLKGSVYEQLLWVIDKLGVTDYWRANLSPLQLTYLPTGQKILFRGVDDPKKSKSIKIRKGYFAYVWYEELDEFDCMAFIDTINQSLLRGGEKFWVFYTYNPPKSANNWVNYEAKMPRPDKVVHHSTYLSVPPEWLGPQFIAEAEHAKKNNYDKYQHEYLGEATGTGGEVFKNVTLRKITAAELAIFDNHKRGLDWGFAADPFAYIVSHYDKTRKRLYIFHEHFALSVSNRKAAEIVKVENKLNRRVICDSSEPKSVSDLKDNNVNAIGARKGPGSVERGIRFLAEDIDEIIIDPERCPNVAREFTTYELEKDRFGNFKSDYPDKNNHTIDAVRYSLEDEMNNATGRKAAFRINY